MKYLLGAYLWVSLLVVALLSVLSYGEGAGYVYIYLRNWQIQSNVWACAIALIILSLIVQLLWLLIRRYLSKIRRQKEQVLSFAQLHPYEKLAVLNVIEANTEQQHVLHELYQPSVLFKDLIQARTAWRSGDFAVALQALDHAPSTVFELAALQRIEIYLSQANSEQALAQLEFLSQHDLSPWLTDVAQGYQLKLADLWGQFAIQFPWQYLYATQFGHLKAEHKTAWLQQVLSDYAQARLEDLEFLQSRYRLLMETQSLNIARENKILWLKILARMPEMALEHTLLAEELLNELFDQDVFYLWFENQLLKQQPEYAQIEQHLNLWEQKYHQLPIFAFARWHVYQATHRKAEAEALLALYPENLLMSYLRIKVQLQGNEQLSEQLTRLFEGDSNYLKMNI